MRQNAESFEVLSSSTANILSVSWNEREGETTEGQ